MEHMLLLHSGISTNGLTSLRTRTTWAWLWIVVSTVYCEAFAFFRSVSTGVRFLLTFGTPSPTARMVRDETESCPTRSLRCGTFLARHIRPRRSRLGVSRGLRLWDSLGGPSRIATFTLPRVVKRGGYFRVPLCLCLLTEDHPSSFRGLLKPSKSSVQNGLASKKRQ